MKILHLTSTAIQVAMKKSITTYTVSSMLLAVGFLYHVDSAQAVDFEPPPQVVIHNGQGGGSSCPSEFNIVPGGYVYADCECWDFKENGSRCYGCSTADGTWEMCIDIMSETYSGTPNRPDLNSSGLAR